MPKMLLRHFLAPCFVVLALPAFALNDLTLSSLAQKGRHHEVIAALAPLVEAGEEVSSFRLLMLSGSYYETGRYKQADDTATRLEARIRNGDGTMFGADLSVYPEIIRGAVALEQGLYAKAIGHASAALTMLKGHQFFHRAQLIQISTILGVASALAGNPEEARRSLVRIGEVSLSMSNLGPEKFTAIARIHMALKEFPQALAAITDGSADVSPALTMFYDPTFQNLPRHFIRSKSQFETGKTDEARRGYDELLAHPQVAQFGTVHWIVLHDRARIAILDGDVDRAIELLQRAIEIIEERRSSIAEEAGRIGFVGDKQEVYGRLVDLLVERGRVAEAFDYVERAKSRALVDLLATRKDFAAPGGDGDSVRRTLAAFEALDQAVLEKSPPDEGGSGKPRVRSLIGERQALAAAAPELISLLSVGSASLAEIGSLLARDEALVEYYHAGDDLYAFVLRGGALQATKLSRQGMEDDIRRLRKAIGAAAGDDWLQPAADLHQRLWRPLQQQLDGVSRISIVAHGMLHYLPFAVLRSSDGRLLIDRHRLAFLPSASVLKLLPPAQRPTEAPLLALGNPDLEDPSLDLRFAAEEAGAVGKLFPGARVLLRKDASETNFRRAGAAFRRLHIASHGSFSAESPLSSGLHLAKDGENDGLLTVGELYSLRLNADLVTLSACETGLGTINSGDDVVGLGRGFLYAGARSVVASLWSVEDRATSHLMQGFYRALASRDKAEALRQAQLATRRSFPHPFFWAAFQLTGAAN